MSPFEDFRSPGAVEHQDRFIAILREPALKDKIPPAPPGKVDDALAKLKVEGLELTHEGLAAGSHLFGRLWKMIEEEGKRR